MNEQIYSSEEYPEHISCLAFLDLESETRVDTNIIQGYRLPGVIDLHIHGAFGWDFSFGNPDRIEEMLDKLLQKGITGLLATLITTTEEQRCKAIEDIVAVALRRKKPPTILGIYLEGPFLSATRRGSHDESLLIAPNFELLKKWQDLAKGMIRIVTIAPELPNAIELIPAIQKELKMRVAVGHTDSDHKTAVRAFEAGATHVTHLYNAMKPFTHREPTAVSAVLRHRSLSVELIADCIHICPEILQMSFHILGADRIVLISDCVMPAGLSNGTYDFYGLNLNLIDGQCRTPEGKLFGGARLLPDCFPLITDQVKISRKNLVKCVFTNPCNVLGIDLPKTDVLFDKNFNWLATKFEGKWYWLDKTN